MAFRQLLVPWQIQPPAGTPLDWTNPDTAGLILCQVGSQPNTNLAGQGTFTRVGGTTLVTTRVGASQLNNASDYYTYDPPATLTAATILSVESRVGSSDQHGPWRVNNTDNDYTPFTDGLFYLNTWGNVRWLSGASATYDQASYVVAVRGSAGAQAAFVNGVQIGTGSATFTVNAQLEIGRNSVIGGIISRSALRLLWNRSLDSTAIKRISDNPWALFQPQVVYIPIVAAASGSTGTSATTNANDTSSAAGTTTVTGSSAKTNANDASTASGATTVVGTSAKTNANDTSSASGSVGSSVSGSSATTNAADTSSASGNTTVVGTSAKTNANDSSSAAGATTLVGTSTTTNANDSASASGAAGTVSGTSATTNANDAAAALGVSGNPVTKIDAGRPKRRPIVVEIDGEDFVVDSPDQAIALLDKAKEVAEEKAKTQIQRAVKAERRQPRKIVADAKNSLPVPTIKATGLEDYAQRILQDIRSTYESAIRTIEVEAQLKLRQRLEQDDEDVLMLIS